jgi:hypothetical protein
MKCVVYNVGNVNIGKGSNDMLQRIRLQNCLVASLLCLAVVGCVTDQASKTTTGIKLQGMANAKCITHITLDGLNQNKYKDKFTVTSTQKGRNGWVSGTIIANTGSYMDNVYYNEGEDFFICGSSSFRKKGLLFVPRN